MYSPANKAKTTIFLCLISLILIFGLNWDSIRQLQEHRYFIYEQDAYMHLVLAQDYLQNSTLQEQINYRINTPWGSDIHGWTNLVTLLLAGGALFFKLFLPLKSALYLWAFYLPLIANLLALGAMLWAIKPLQISFYQQLFILLAFLINPFLHSYFLALRVDYDFVQILLGIIYWGFLLRFVTEQSYKQSIGTGFVACLGLWTSITFIIPLLLGFVFLCWLSYRNKITHTAIYGYLITLIVGLLPIIFIEHRHFFTASYDVISIVHLVFVTGLLIAYTLHQFFTPTSRLAQITLIMALFFLLFWCMNFLYPGFYLGPYNQVSPFLLNHFFPNVSEFYSPFAIDNALALALLCYFFIGGGYFYYLTITTGLVPQQVVLFFSALVMSGLTAYMYRWCIFSLPLMIWLTSFWVDLFKKNTRLVQASILLFTLFLPSLILMAAANYTKPEQQLCEAQLHLMLERNFFENPQFAHDKSLFAPSNLGPLLLFFTQFSIVGTNDHHNPQGFKDSYYFFKGSESLAKKIADKRNIDLILICPSGYPLEFNPLKSTWLKRIPLTTDYSQWQLYRKVG